MRAPRLRAAFLAATLLVAGAGLAIGARQLPDNAQFAKNAQFGYPYVKIGSNTLRLAVGGKIYNQQNLIIIPVSAPAVANVLFKTDLNGEISQIWILTDEEARRYVTKPFGSSLTPATQ